MSAVVYVNGKISDAATATVPVFDHGFLYGEGIYETLRTYRRRPFLFERHMRRLRQSAGLMALDVPYSDEELRARMDETVAAHTHLRQGSGGQEEAEAYIRVLLTRGVGELTYNPAATPKPSLVIIVKPFPAPPERTFAEGIRLALVNARMSGRSLARWQGKPSVAKALFGRIDAVLAQNEQLARALASLGATLFGGVRGAAVAVGGAFAVLDGGAGDRDVACGELRVEQAIAKCAATRLAAMRESGGRINQPC